MPIKWERIVKNTGSTGIFYFHIQLKAMSVHLFNPLFQLDINLPRKKQYTKWYQSIQNIISLLIKGNIDERQVKILSIVALVLGMLARQSTAGFPSCYAKCFGECIITRFSPLKCGFKCMKCIVDPSSSQPNSYYYCKLGCVMNACTNISTKQDLGNSLSLCFVFVCFSSYLINFCFNLSVVAKLTRCVDSCSKMCTTKSPQSLRRPWQACVFIQLNKCNPNQLDYNVFLT